MAKEQLSVNFNQPFLSAVDNKVLLKEIHLTDLTT